MAAVTHSQCATPLHETPLSPDFPRYGVSRSPLSNIRRYAANEKDPSTSVGMTLREQRFLNIPFAMHGISIPLC